LRSGAADLDGDGRIALDELYEYVYGRVVDESPQQRPRKWAFDVEGQIFVAKAEGATDTPPVPRRPRPQPQRTASSGRRRLRALRSKRLVAVGAAAAVVVVAAVAAAAVFMNRSSSEPPQSPAALAEGRNATITVYEAWQGDKLATLDPSVISASARRALAKMPTHR
jgi:hypothetical protein